MRTAEEKDVDIGIWIREDFQTCGHFVLHEGESVSSWVSIEKSLAETFLAVQTWKKDRILVVAKASMTSRQEA